MSELKLNCNLSVYQINNWVSEYNELIDQFKLTTNSVDTGGETEYIALLVAKKCMHIACNILGITNHEKVVADINNSMIIQHDDWSTRKLNLTTWFAPCFTVDELLAYGETRIVTDTHLIIYNNGGYRHEHVKPSILAKKFMHGEMTLDEFTAEFEGVLTNYFCLDWCEARDCAGRAVISMVARYLEKQCDYTA